MSVDIKQLNEVVPGVRKKNEKTYYIQCSVEGTLHYCNADRLEKLIKKYGSLEAVGTGYKSRNANQKAKVVKGWRRRKKGDPTITNEEDKPKRVYNYLNDPLPDFRNLKARSKHGDSDARVYNISSHDGAQCLRPALVAKNEGWCNGCPWWHYCQLPLKAWKKKAEDPDRINAWNNHKNSTINYYTETERDWK